MRSISPKALFLLVLATTSVGAADITVLGGYNEIASGVVVAGAGLQGNFSSISGVTTLSITNATGAWTVRARRTAEGWHSHLRLFVKRTSAGSGSGYVNGGEAFVEVTGNELEMFAGSANRSNLSIQYRITGLSQLVPPQNYTSSIIFSVH